jgi:uncharacterized SAM-binding protein YcdF (DUF218 family)
MFFFWLKKSVAFWFMPLPFCLVLLIAGWLLARSARRARLGRGLMAAGILLLLLLSNKAVGTWLLRPLEAQYPPVPELAAGAPAPAMLQGCRYVLVLGGGHADVPELAAMDQLSDSARARIMEGVRILRALPDAQLVVSGHGTGDHPSHAAVLAQAAVSLGVDPARILRLDTPKDTEEEARDAAPVIGEARFALVTSAWHMPRAMALMRHAGLHPVACPADFQAKRNPEFRLMDCTWDTEALGRSTMTVYERLGRLWSALRGKT